MSFGEGENGDTSQPVTRRVRGVTMGHCGMDEVPGTSRYCKGTTANAKGPMTSF